jgi:uridine kinase
MLDDFAGWVTEYQDDSLRRDAFNRANRVYQLLNQIMPITDDSAIPTDSVLREFIGGSSFEY